MRKKILILTDYYLPGVKGGGPIQSIRNMVDNLADEFDFYILTSDRDFGDNRSYNNIKTDVWLQVGKAKVYYTDKSKLSFRKLDNILNKFAYDIIYLNSFFSYKFSIMPILLKRVNRISAKIVLAPRGEFSPGALGLKSNKKKLYIQLSKIIKMYTDVRWHATAITEKKDIESIFGEKVNIFIAGNLTGTYKGLQFKRSIEKKKNELKVVFISRIHPKKNLKQALVFLKSLKGNIKFNIYGPIEDKSYWDECKEVIEDLPKTISVSYKGVINHDKVTSVFKSHHVFLFPTLGENFGHVIYEALISGCPVIISNQTPWRNLESIQVGWDIDLSDKNKFIRSLQTCVDMGRDDYTIISKNAFYYGIKKANKRDNITNTSMLFH